MAKNTGRGSRIAAGIIQPRTTNMWTRRDNNRGIFLDAKTHGDTFKGVLHNAGSYPR